MSVEQRGGARVAEVRPILESLCDDTTRGEFIFESPVEGKAMSDIKTGFTGAVRDASINNLTFHDLRHTWSTRAEESGQRGRRN